MTPLKLASLLRGKSAIDQEILLAQHATDDALRKEAVEIANYDAITVADILLALPKHEQIEKIELYCGDDESFRQELEALLEVMEDISINDSNLIDESIHNTFNEKFEPQDLIGNKIKEFVLKRFVAEGGYGLVYEAERFDKLSEQRTAVKILRPEVSRIASYDIIGQETQMMMRLNDDPNIVSVHNYGSFMHNGKRFDGCIMEYIEGEDIATFFDARPLVTIDQRIAAIIKIAKSLHYAHRLRTSKGRGIVHGDVKPHNILVKTSGEPVLLDFSISSTIIDDENIPSEEANEYLQEHSSDYSSPEFLSRKSIDHRSDIYSLGVILREVVTGITPDKFTEQNLPSKSAKLNNDDKKYQWYLKALDSIIKKATAHKREDRYESMDDFTLDLVAFVKFKPLSFHDDNWKTRFYRFYKLNPLIGLSIAASFILSVTALTFHGKDFYDEFKQEKQLSMLERYIDDMHSFVAPKLNKSNSEETIVDSLFAKYRDHKEYLKDEQKQFVLNHIIDVAQKTKQVNKELQLIIAMKQDTSLGENNILLQAKYINALYRTNDYDRADKLAQELLRSIDIDDLNHADEIKAIISLYEFSSHFLMDEEESFSHVDFLKRLSFNKLLLDDEKSRDYYFAMIKYYIAQEIYYSVDGDYASATIGHTEEEYQEIASTFRGALRDINSAINHMRQTNKRLSDIAPLLLLEARLLYETRNIDLAKAKAKIAIEHVERSWGEETPQAYRAYMIDFAINRFVDLERSIYSTEKMHVMDRNPIFPKFRGTTYHISSLLHAGKVDLAKVALHQVGKDFDLYFNSGFEYPIPYADIDGIKAAYITFLQYTGFQQDEDSVRYANKLKDVLSYLRQYYPDRFSAHEQLIVDIYHRHVLSDTHEGDIMIDIHNAFNEMVANKDNSSHSDVNIALDFALIAQAAGENESALQFLGYIEKYLVANDFERAYSTDVLTTFIYMSQAYRELGNIQKARDYFTKAKVIYQNHEKVLSNSYFDKQLSSLEVSIYGV